MGEATLCTCSSHGPVNRTGANIPGLPLLAAPQYLGRKGLSISGITLLSVPTHLPSPSGASPHHPHPGTAAKDQANSNSLTCLIQGLLYSVLHIPDSCDSSSSPFPYFYHTAWTLCSHPRHQRSRSNSSLKRRGRGGWRVTRSPLDLHKISWVLSGYETKPYHTLL